MTHLGHVEQPLAVRAERVDLVLAVAAEAKQLAVLVVDDLVGTTK